MQQIYSIVMAAKRGGSMACFPGACLANSEDEARGKAYKFSLDSYRVEDGWTSHGASVFLISDKMIENAGWTK